MCIGIPAQVISINGNMGEISVGGVMRQVGLELVEGVQIGDYVIIHAGFAIQKINQAEAEETLRLLQELAEAGGGWE